MNSYEAFLLEKGRSATADGFAPVTMPSHLFPFQQDLVDWAVRLGRGAIFADCGLGKTPIELAWAENVFRRTGRPVLLLTPLAVGFQIAEEAERFGHDAAVSRDGRVAAAITITNYEQIAKFDPDQFAGVVCDESSAIKAFDGVTRTVVTEFLRHTSYRLLATATAAPNDWVELGTASEAVGAMGYVDMLTRFFTNRQQTTTNRSRFAAGGRDVEWRLKGHAAEPFWQWVASWARAVRRPSDLGFEDDGFLLPELIERQTVIEASTARPGTLFDVPAAGLQEEREETRRTLPERCEAAAAAIADAHRAVAWCHLNDESQMLTKLIDGAVEITGADTTEAKEEALLAFTHGEIRVLVTKPSIGAWGLNWQHCHRMTYFPSHSYEQYYQAVRRCLRFGQTQPVEVDVITTEGGRAALTNLQRKSAQADAMFAALVSHMRDAARVEGPSYDNPVEVPAWLAS